VVGDLGEAVEQVMARVGCQRGGALSRWATAGMGEMNRQARSSGGVMGLDTHMIAGSRACSTSIPAQSPDLTNQTNQHFAEALGQSGATERTDTLDQTGTGK
jgi:hypothetical protein